MSINNEMSSAEVAGSPPVPVPSVDAVANAAPPACTDLKGRSGREIMYRHSIAVRITHWVNVACLALLLMSGLRLFNYHPALYFGNYGYAGLPSVFSIDAVEDPESGDPVGVATIGGRHYITTGVLGVAFDSAGMPVPGAFPNWITLPGGPGLGLARDWHFALAWLFVLNGVAYLLFGLLSGHLRRDLVPTGSEFRLHHIGGEILDHLRLRRPRGAAARHYNVLQKLAYLTVIFVLLPLMVLTGLTMSPAVTAAVPVLFDLFGGRQSARTIHFIVATLLVLFVLVHVIEVLIAGPFNELRSMVTGRFAIRPEERR